MKNVWYGCSLDLLHGVADCHEIVRARVGLVRSASALYLMARAHSKNTIVAIDSAFWVSCLLVLCTNHSITYVLNILGASPLISWWHRRVPSLSVVPAWPYPSNYNSSQTPTNHVAAPLMPSVISTCYSWTDWFAFNIVLRRCLN